jgi:hypothetical protein
MSSPYTGNPATPVALTAPTITCPSDGDAANAASVNTALQKLADEVAFSKTKGALALGVNNASSGVAAGLQGSGGSAGTGASGSGAGVMGTGGGLGSGVYGVGGATAGASGVQGQGTGAGVGVYGTGGSTGHGVSGISGGLGGAGVSGLGSGLNSDGVRGQGGGSGAGVLAVSGGTGPGLRATPGFSGVNNVTIDVTDGALRFTNASPNPASTAALAANVLCAANIVKAWGRISTVPAVVVNAGATAFNVASVAAVGTNIRVTFAQPMAGAMSYVVLLTGISNAVWNYSTLSASYFEVSAVTLAGAAIDLSTTGTGFSFVVLGFQ